MYATARYIVSAAIVVPDLISVIQCGLSAVRTPPFKGIRILAQTGSVSCLTGFSQQTGKSRQPVLQYLGSVDADNSSCFKPALEWLSSPEPANARLRALVEIVFVDGSICLSNDSCSIEKRLTFVQGCLDIHPLCLENASAKQAILHSLGTELSPRSLCAFILFLRELLSASIHR